MISAVAATIPTRVMMSRTLFRRFADAWTWNVRPDARRLPNAAIANVTTGRIAMATTRPHGSRSTGSPRAMNRQIGTHQADDDDRPRQSP